MSEATQTIAVFRDKGVLRALDVHLARTLGRLTGVSDPLALLGAAGASRAQGAGHVCLDLAGFRDQIRGEDIDFEAVDWPDPDRWHAALSACPGLVRGPDDDRRTPLVLEGRRLYLDRYWGYQRRLVEQVRARLAVCPTDIEGVDLDAALTRLFRGSPDPKELQKQAAELAARRGFTIITGGPGTGKTTTIKRLMALLVEAARANGQSDPRFMLMAPTGKASARMKESIQKVVPQVPLRAAPEVIEALPSEASTIHLALGWTPMHRTRFKRNAESPLAADVVIVDEASMIDLAMMTKLFEAVPPEARLILLGDADQLRSIESGAVLGDLIEGLDTGTLKLEYAHRFGADSGVGALSRAINAGSYETTLAYLNREKTEDPAIAAYDELTWLPLDKTLKFKKLRAAISSALYRIVMPELKPFRDAVAQENWAEALTALDGFRVLAAHRKGPLGVRGLNTLIQGWVASKYGFSTTDEHYIGRPILVTRNDREQDLYNGDVGFIARDANKRPVAIFPAPGKGAFREVPVARLPPCETVYAMTIHKSQGSQMTHALVALPVEPSRIVTRELLYTAVTRAAERVTIIGSEESLKAGVKQPVARSSGLAEALKSSA